MLLLILIIKDNALDYLTVFCFWNLTLGQVSDLKVMRIEWARNKSIQDTTCVLCVNVHFIDLWLNKNKNIIKSIILFSTSIQ